MSLVKRFALITVILSGFCRLAVGQEDDLLSLIDDDEETTELVTAAFKSTRVINSHSIEQVGGGVLDFRINHRFGMLNTGSYDLFGLDQASIRLSLDYGVTKNLAVGVGRSTYEKEVDGFLKYKLLWQSTGAKKMPVSLILVTGMTVNGLKWEDPDRENYFSSRLAYYYQAIIGRKFSESFSLQVAPIMVHRNLVETAEDNHDVFAVEMGGRIKLSNRIALTVDYFYTFPDQLPDEVQNALAIGFDIETGGHVFQLHFTNATPMNERAIITETTGKWGEGDIHFGFNISRVFTLSDPRK
jgi:hypothetical protein